DGVVRMPSAFSMTLGVLPSITATQELVVPRSIPMTLAMVLNPFLCGRSGWPVRRPQVRPPELNGSSPAVQNTAARGDFPWLIWVGINGLQGSTAGMGEQPPRRPLAVRCRRCGKAENRHRRAVGRRSDGPAFEGPGGGEPLAHEVGAKR